MSVTGIRNVLVVAVGVVTASALAAQTPQAPQMPQHQMADQMKMSPEMAKKCQALMAERDKMTADMAAADQTLDGLVTTMNRATPSEQPAATALVVTEMVAQRQAMHAGMMKMHQGMMSHMMEHMAEGKDSMAMCPMMKHKS
jgi:hypothetical protein